MRYEEHQRDVESRKTFELIFPDGLKEEKIGDYLHALRETLRGGRWSLTSPTIVLEVLFSETGPEHRLRVPESIAEQVCNQLESHITDISIEEIAEPTQPRWLVAREYGTSKTWGQLDIRSAGMASNTLLGTGRSLADGEMLSLQILFTSTKQSTDKWVPKARSTKADRLMKPYSFISPDMFRPSQELLDERKAKQEEPNFSGIIRVAAKAKTTDRANSLVGGLVNALGSVNGKARFKAVGTFSDAPMRVNGASLPWRYPARLMLSELAAVTAVPIGSPNIPGLKRPSTRHMRAHPIIPREGIVLGHSTASVDRKVALNPHDAMMHVLTLGKNGTGKSSVFKNAASQISRTPWISPAGKKLKQGFLVLDPHGDLTESILSDIPADRINDVIYIDPTDPCPVGLNLLSGTSPSLITSYMMGVLESLFGTGPLTGHVLRNTITTVAMHPGMTLHEVALALDDPEFRDQITRDVHDEQLKRYWTRYENLSRAEQSQSTEPVMRRLGAFLTPEFRGIFGQSGGLDVQAAINSGKIIVINLAQGKIGERNADLLGAMVVAKLWAAVKERANIPEAERRPFYLFVDEAPRFMKLPTSLGDMLAEARKFRLSCWLATQSIGQISEIRNDVVVNTRTKIVFESSIPDGRIIGQEIGVDAEDIARLPEHTAILSVPHAPAATIRTIKPADPLRPASEVIAASRANYGKPMEDVELEIAARRTYKPQHKRTRPKVGRED